IALRLARFDSELPDPPETSKDFFTGVPAPAAAFLVIVPIAVDLEFGIGWAREAAYVCFWLVLIGVMAVSAIPTFAGKRLKLPVGAVLPVLAAVSLLIAGAFMQPWITYLVIAGIYAAAIPVAVIRYRQQSSD
ncbi:MAG: phosphatidylcholine/phosphatidylserine synthase, partial [Alphaproteobacteria bacterium]